MTAAVKVVLWLVRWTLTLMSIIFTPLTNWIFSCVYDGSARCVPPVKDEILLVSATQLARKIRSRECTAVGVMEQFIARICEVHPYVNAIIARRFDEALAEARDLDEALDNAPNDEKYSEKNSPFLGVPLTVKEAFAVKGMPNASGLVERKDYVCEEDCPVVRNIRLAGAIPFCMTNVSELCMWYESANRLYGRTRNPYNTARIVGGSSGGEACNIASGGAVIGIGSDIGGSIRMPAFFNGIFGHRPSKGLVSNLGQFPIPTGKDMDMLSTGPLCRYMDDLLPLLKVMAGPNVKQVKLDTKVNVKELCIYTVVDDGGSLLVSNVDPQLKEAQSKVASFLRDNIGAEVKTITIPKFKYSADMWTAKMTTSGGMKFCEYMANQNGSINPYKEFLKWLIGCSNHTLPALALGMVEKVDHLLEAQNKVALVALERLAKEMEDLLGDNAVMLYPSHPKIAPYHNEPILHPMNWSYTGIFNVLGLPVTQVPLGLSRDGLPVGVQVVSGMNRDHLTIAVAGELARAGVAGWVNPGS